MDEDLLMKLAYPDTLVTDHNVTDQQLDEIIQRINGEVQVPRRMLRASIHRVDHDNVVERRHSVVRRRVPHPNYLWQSP